jgi:hypothetical protein
MLVQKAIFGGIVKDFYSVWGFSFCGRIRFGRIRKEVQKDDKKALI